MQIIRFIYLLFMLIGLILLRPGKYTFLIDVDMIYRNMKCLDALKVVKLWDKVINKLYVIC